LITKPSLKLLDKVLVIVSEIIVVCQPLNFITTTHNLCDNRQNYYYDRVEANLGISMSSKLSIDSSLTLVDEIVLIYAGKFSKRIRPFFLLPYNAISVPNYHH